MQTLKKFITFAIMSLFMVSSTYAIDIEPEHEAIIEQPIVVAPKASDLGVSHTIKAPVVAPVPQVASPALPQASPQALPNITEQTSALSSVILPNNEERIYYARSVTSNNPEYKTRFSILHNTPSPKRIAGERLYNLSDNFFRLKVVGNTISILDNPVFNLIGINSAAGRYGEIKILNGSLLTIHSASKNFKGNWDLDGTGERMLKVTPTNLISGVIPVHIKTFKADGSVVTDEVHDLVFKALAMGPYNGYWSDGADIGVFLWGMSSLKLQSKEMAYLGLDFGIVTQNSVENTKKTVAAPEEDNEELLPNAVIPAIAPSNTEVKPLFDNQGYQSSPFAGGLPFITGIGGGGLGRNNFVPIPIRPNPSVPDCSQTPNDPKCVPDCTKTPNDPKCVPDCTKTPNDPKCVPDCSQTPNDPKCVPDCTQTPNDPKCVPDCTKTPNDPKCVVDCTKTPNDPRCVVDCTKTPNDPRCVVDCVLHPTAPSCQDDCIKNPLDPKCGDYCIKNPTDPKCSDFCKHNPNHPVCCAIDCKANPLAPGCEDYCTKNPYSPECCVLNPSQCNPTDICVKNPNLPQCKDNPTTPVSEPFMPLVMILSILGYLRLRRKS